jgi:hypothetical protein
MGRVPRKNHGWPSSVRYGATQATDRQGLTSKVQRFHQVIEGAFQGRFTLLQLRLTVAE